jgi:hypothetical protein
MPQSDSFTVFETPVDSVRVAAQDVTSSPITSLLNLSESLEALWNLIHLEYIFFVCVSYYIVVTRIPWLKTNTFGRRNLTLFILTVLWGLIGHLWRGTPTLNLLVTGLCVNAFYEFIFKGAFRLLERWGITPLPGWQVEEIRKEKEGDIARAQSVQKPNDPIV